MKRIIIVIAIFDNPYFDKAMANDWLIVKLGIMREYILFSICCIVIRITFFLQN